MLGLLVWGFWIVLGAYILWFLFKADTLQPLTLDDLALTWRIHKLEMGCKASRIYRLITKKNEVVGFKCDCGYEFVQKRLITQKTHMYPQTRIQSLTSSKGASPLPKTRHPS